MILWCDKNSGYRTGDAHYEMFHHTSVFLTGLSTFQPLQQFPPFSSDIVVAKTNYYNGHHTCNEYYTSIASLNNYMHGKDCHL